MRRTDDYPDYSEYIDYIDENGFTDDIVNRIINAHQLNRCRTKDLYERYKCYEDKVPIFSRIPRFSDGLEDGSGNAVPQLNNKVNNDFFGEINDVMVGYFAGKAASYSYAEDESAESATGGEAAVEAAKKALSEFVTRNNMYDVNLEATKFASVCGYAGRLFYIDRHGDERVMVVPPYETIVLARDKIQEPDYAVRYYATTGISGAEVWHADAYDGHSVHHFGGALGNFIRSGEEEHLFDFCPLQAIPLNGEMLSSAERVMALIDEYDKTVSDNANDAEGNTHALQVLDGIGELSQAQLAEVERAGVLQISPGYADSTHRVYYLTKDINDSFNEHHLDRLERNIYRFSKTPNLNDETFNAASGISLKFKLTAFEAKCGAFEAKMNSADTYMFRLLGSAFMKKSIPFDYLQAYVEYKRNFPVDVLSEAQAVQALINAGVPDEIAYNQLSAVDDIDYLLALKEERQQDALNLFGKAPESDETAKEGAAGKKGMNVPPEGGEAE